MVVRTDAATLPEYQKYLADNPNAKVTFDQMQHVRTQDSIVEVPQVTPTIEAAMWQILSEDRPVRQTFDELQRQLVVLAQGAKR
jgi:sn-glycerol 3-phosphate transport system substrate-binding protein